VEHKHPHDDHGALCCSCSYSPAEEWEDVEERDQYGNEINTTTASAGDAELTEWKRAYYWDKFGVDSLNNDIHFTETLVKVCMLTCRIVSHLIGVCDRPPVGTDVLLPWSCVLELV
jgi:hypothetical protein